MCERSSSPVDSICVPACSARMRLKFSCPARFSAIHSRAKSPDWISREDVAHLLAGLVGDDALAARVVAVLGRVGDPEAHPLQALLVHEVDDELELVQALEVRHLRRVARLDERLEAGLDELRRAAAQDGLLAEEVGLVLVLERRLDHAAARAADALRVRERDVLRVSARVLGDCDQARHPAALEVLAAHEVARPLRRDEPDVDAGRRLDLAVVDREPVAEQQRVAVGDPVAHLVLVDVVVQLVGNEDHHDVPARRRLGDRQDLEPRLARRCRPTRSSRAGRRPPIRRSP